MLDGEGFRNVITDYSDKDKTTVVAKQLRWKSLPQVPKDKQKTFLQGLFSFCGSGSAEEKKGISIMGYSFNKDMGDNFFYSIDGDWLFVPQRGNLHLDTEMGKLLVKIGEFAVIPAGVKFRVMIPGNEDIQHQGWICEIYGTHLHLPELGPLGANGLANPQDFKIPVADFSNEKGEYRIFAKFLGKFFVAESENSPLDIVAWRGNYYPFKYDFRNYNTMNSVSFDHPDPSIFTVLSAMSSTPGVAILDLVVFKQRFMVAENTFRPPYYHRNIMTEFMGNIYGEYDAKPSGGFEPGCSSLHSPMTPHGPESSVFEKASTAELEPVKYKDTMSFMFESCFVLRIANSAIGSTGVPVEDEKYHDCWKGFQNHFNSG